MGQTWNYDAFISYRHTEPDSFVAQNLHKQLESLKLPGNVARRMQDGGETAKTKITRVFRDKEELPLVSNLADPIMEALEQSEFLIVICSPRLNESIWCKKEIETFLKLHGRERILLVLVEGEPEDSFPPELLYREEEEIAEDGSVSRKRIPVEPLAADVRGESQSEIRKKIKSETLRLAAPMFGCSYDDLKQRHREQRMRKILTAALAGSSVCLLFGLISTTMALQISRQNRQITAQSEEISAQAEEIETQYALALRNHCISQAKEAENLLEKGDRIGAIETALEVFPGGVNEDIPYTAKVAYALSESLRVYENNSQILPDRILEADTTIDFMEISPEGSRILTMDDFGMICVWDGASGERLTSFLLEKDLYHGEDEIAFLDEDTFFYPSEAGVDCYDILTGTVIYHVDCEEVAEIGYAKESDKAVISTEDGFILIQGKSGKVDATGKLSGAKTEDDQTSQRNEIKLQDGAVFNEEGTLFAMAFSSGDDNLVAVYDAKTGELYRRYAVAYSDVKSMRFSEGVLYVVDNEEFRTGDSVWNNNAGGILYACDLTADDTFLWTYVSENQWLYKAALSSKEGSNYMLCTAYDGAVVLDRRNGAYIDNFFFNSEIVKLGNYTGTDSFMVFTRDGVWHYVNLDIMTDLVGTTFSNCTSNNVKMFEIGEGYSATLPYLDKKITLYRMAAGSRLEQICETENQYAEAVLSGDGKYLAISSYVSGYTTYVEMMDTDTGEMLWHFEADNHLRGMSFYPDKNVLALITGDGIYLLDEENGEQKAFYEKGEQYGDYLQTDETGRYIIFRNSRTLYAQDLEDGSLLYEIEDTELFRDNNAVATDPSMQYLAAVSKDADVLRLYDLEALRQGQKDCLQELEGINATYVETLFFDDKEAEAGRTLYMVYKDGDIIRYSFDAEQKKLIEEGTLSGLEESVNSFIQAKGADFDVLAGNSDAYLIYDVGQQTEAEIIARINGFLAADGARNCIYLTDGTCIYRTPFYDETLLREEAELQLGTDN
ncbi:MAG: PQQ-binding-like beta-propeller repeat protein [Muribaculaceae bacterium]|nr:PQQ-binding-like beta-propeller repeat protein [Muribaculaceae bacterium]